MTVINIKKKYIFIANMKTASTLIHKLLKQDKPDLISMRTIYETPIGKHDNYMRIKKYLKTINYEIDDFYIFGFVREPCDRLISCFKHDLNGKYLPYKFQQIYKYDLRSFVSYIIYNQEKHFRSFKYMFCNEQGRLPDNLHIFKYEDLIKIIPSIFSKFNIYYPNNLPVINPAKNNITFDLPKNIKDLIKKRYRDDWKYYNSY
jgi:hypothetical protein